MIYWLIYWFMFPTCIGIVAFAMLLGIDGTAIFTPFMILLFPLLGVPFISPAVAVTVGLTTEFFGFLSGIAAYRGKRLIDFKMGWQLVAIGIPVIVAFSFVAQFVSGTALKLIFGSMMVLIAFYLILTAKSAIRGQFVTPSSSNLTKRVHSQDSTTDSTTMAISTTGDRYAAFDNRKGLLISGIGSALEGMMSVGLGELLMPDLIRRCKIQVSIAAATSVFVMTLTVLAGSITDILTLFAKGGAGIITWNLMAYTIPGAMIGGQVGAKLQGRLSSSNIEKLIAFMFIIIGIGFLYESLPSLL